MKPIVMSVADHAYVDPTTGKLYVLGTFTRLLFTEDESFPLSHSEMSFVVKLISEQLIKDESDKHRPNNDLGEHHLRIALSDSDAIEIARVETPFSVSRGEGGLPLEVNFIWKLKNVTFRKAGVYQFVVNEDLADDE